MGPDNKSSFFLLTLKFPLFKLKSPTIPSGPTVQMQVDAFLFEPWLSMRLTAVCLLTWSYVERTPDVHLQPPLSSTSCPPHTGSNIASPSSAVLHFLFEKQRTMRSVVSTKLSALDPVYVSEILYRDCLRSFSASFSLCVSKCTPSMQPTLWTTPDTCTVYINKKFHWNVTGRKADQMRMKETS